MVKYVSGQLITSAAILICIGCASSTKTAEMIALTAAHHVSAYEQDVGEKIKAENDYYDAIMQYVTKNIKRFRENEQPRELEIEVEEFVQKNNNKNDAEIRQEIFAFLETSLSSWAEREEKYIQLMNEMKYELEKKQQTLAFEKSKISLLKNKLTTLAEARSHKEMLTLMLAYAGQVKSELNSLQESSNKANDKANEAIEDTMKKKEEKKKENEKGKTDKADKDHGK